MCSEAVFDNDWTCGQSDFGSTATKPVKSKPPEAIAWCDGDYTTINKQIKDTNTQEEVENFDVFEGAGEILE